VVIVPCSDGQRGILRNHCSLLTGLTQGILQVKSIPDRPDALYVIEGGFARFSENNLTILAYDAVSFEGMAPDKVQDMISRARTAILSPDAGKTPAGRAQLARNRLIIRMAEMASLVTPTAP
jgi:F0F1-type ATP synthase epsilon subunit